MRYFRHMIVIQNTYLIFVIYQNIKGEKMALSDPIIPNYGQDEDLQAFSLPIQIVFSVIAIISSIISLLFPIVYFARRKCREHPSSLIAVISLLEALSNYNVILIAVNIYTFQHIVKITEVFQFLLFSRSFQPSEEQFCQVNFTIYILLELMSIAYNISFSADLLVTLKNPFYSGSRRMKFYNIFSVLFVTLSIPLSILEAEKICQQEFHKRSIYKIPFAFLMCLALFYLVSIIIILMSFRTVQTNQIRQKYIRLHRTILLTLLILWLCPIITNIFILCGDQESQLFNIFNFASFACLLISGAIVNIVRFYNDPYVWGQVKNSIISCKTKKKNKKKEEENQNDSPKEQQDLDAWNLPIAHAVQASHHQRVISYILEIVLQTCTNTPQERAIHRSQFNQSNSEQRYHAQSTILSLKQIKKMLREGTKEDVKRLTKIIKKEEMFCVENKQKNIYKYIDFLEPTDLEADQSVNQQATHKISNFIKENKAITIKVKSYGDPVFLALRLLDNITSDQLHKTLNLTLNADNIKKARESLGASGSFFFFSYDNRLVIKTINRSESKIFLSFLPEYYEHILSNPHSLISRAYGLFSVQIQGISKIYFIMMENTLRAFEENKVRYVKYDLKGSTIKREVKNPNADVLKDINFLKSDDAFLLMSQARKKQLFEQIKSDITLLNKQNIMDYSLLLGIGNYKKIKRENNRIIDQSDLTASQNEWRCFDDGHNLTGKLYSLSLIDYLQKFDFNKYMELSLKKVFKGGGDISSVDAKTYYERFLNFVNRIIVVYRS